MNYYGPRSFETDSGKVRWHYTCSNSRIGIWPEGYCRDGCPGHPTAEEACEHMREYLIDRATFSWLNRISGTAVPCEVCGTPTTTFSVVKGLGMPDLRSLCDAHFNREGLDQVLGTPGEVWSS
jgi:hypothetical protein